MSRPAFALSFLLALACQIACSSENTSSVPSSGSGTSSPSSTQCGSPGRTGKSDCYGVTNACSAGQYCGNGNGNGCKVGCTSDDNCAASEHCVRCGTLAVGTCRSCSDTSDACNVPSVDAGKSDPCQRQTEVDFMCSPSAPKAYNCFGQEPTQSGCAHANGDPTVFCCTK